MKTVAYLKTSLDRREIQEQKQAILEFAQRGGLAVSRFIEMSTSATREKRIDQYQFFSYTGHSFVGAGFVGRTQHL